MKDNPLKKYIDEHDDDYISIFDSFSEIVLPKTQKWAEIEKIQFPENIWLVDKIFPLEGISILASASGEGKSWQSIKLADCISKGEPWLGMFKTVQSKVLYINAEMSISEMKRRGKKIGIDESNENLFFLNSDDFNLNEPENILAKNNLNYKWLIKFIHDNNITVVFIDTFRAVAGGIKEESASDIRKFFLKFQVFKNSGISIIFLEHQRKPTQMEGKIPKKEQLLGSVDKVANLETLLMMRKNDTRDEIEFYQRKNRLGPEINPFSVKMTDLKTNEGNDVVVFEYLGEIDEEANKKDQAKTMILDVLSSGEQKTAKELIEILKKDVGSKNIRSALQELTAKNEIDYIKIGKAHYYFLPKKDDISLSLTEMEFGNDGS